MKPISSIAAAAAILAAGAAASATLDLPGDYGTPAGCKLLADGDYGDDSVVTLTSDAFDTFATGCEFVGVYPVRDGSSVVTALCSHEGEEYRTIEMLRVAKAYEQDAYDVFHANGELWATLPVCGPLE